MSGSVEYKAMIQCASGLTDLLQHDCLSVSSKLLEKGLISMDAFDWVLSAQGVSNHDKAARVVSCVTNRVKSSPQCFHDFVGVLRGESFFADIVEKMTTVHKALLESQRSSEEFKKIQGSQSSSESPQSQAKMCERPKLKDAFKELLPLASEWKSIGALLGLENHVLSRVRADEDGVHDCLREMLSEWLKRVDPPPTWAALADAVETIDEFKAQDIRKHFM